MQGPTHLVTGILIQKSLRKVQPLPLQYSAVVALAVLSHGVLDRLARATYHPPAPLANDWFWAVSHLIIGVLTVCIVVRSWRDYKLSMVCSILPDLDWVLRPVVKLFSVEAGETHPLHTLVLRFMDLFVPPTFWDALPNWNLERKGLIVEVILFAMLLTCIHGLGERESSESHGHGSFSS